MKIVSGGQTGVDRAALDAALDFGAPCGGWCPCGRRAEDGIIALRYPLQETPSDDYAERTAWNVRDSDGTLILTWGTPIAGVKLTGDLANQLKKPLMQVDMERTVSTEEILAWIKSNRITVLNIAGPRESLRPGKIYSDSFLFLKRLFQAHGATR